MHHWCHKQSAESSAPCAWQSFVFLIVFILSSLSIANGAEHGHCVDFSESEVTGQCLSQGCASMDEAGCAHHCCHIIAHFTGIAPVSLEASVVRQTAENTDYRFVVKTYTPRLSLPPPIL